MTETLPTPTEEQPLLTTTPIIEPETTKPIPENNASSNVPVSLSHSTTRALLVVGFGLLFVLGARVTFAYLKGAPVRQPGAAPSQTAAADAAATATLPNTFASVQLIAQSAYVYDLTTHQELFTLNPDAVRPLASLTKIAMALAVSQALPPDMPITIPYDTEPPGSAEILTQGSVWPMHDVLSFTLVASSNQGADILAAAANDAIHAEFPQSPMTSTTSATIWRMNDIAQGLGLTNMQFDNDNGLDITTTQSGAYGSARDVADLLAYAASTSPSAFAGTTQSTMTFTNAEGQRATAYNTDTALGSISGIVMGKTGYTDLAGGNLAVIFDAGLGHPIVAVVLGSTEDGRFTDMKQLVDAANAAVAQGQ